MAAYEFYFNKYLLPTAPESLEVKINNKNSLVTLADGSEINILKSPGLTDITFTARLPIANYSWANTGGATEQVRFLNLLEQLKTQKAAFDFTVLRNRSDYSSHKSAVFSTNIKCSVEDYTIKEDAGEGGDVLVEINLKQFKQYNITLGYNSRKQLVTGSSGTISANVTIVTQRGDTLDRIVSRYYDVGNSERTRASRAVYQANSTVLSRYGIKLTVGTVSGTLSPLPAGLKLLLPAVL